MEECLGKEEEQSRNRVQLLEKLPDLSTSTETPQLEFWGAGGHTDGGGWSLPIVPAHSLLAGTVPL